MSAKEYPQSMESSHPIPKELIRYAFDVCWKMRELIPNVSRENMTDELIEIYNKADDFVMYFKKP